MAGPHQLVCSELLPYALASSLADVALSGPQIYFLPPVLLASPRIQEASIWRPGFQWLRRRSRLLLPPRWLDIQDEVTEHLAEIAKQTRKLDQLHQKHILPGFDDEEVKKREEREIEQLTQDITFTFQKCQKAIKRIEFMVREAKQQGSLHQGEEIMARNLKISLATRVGDVSAMFRKKQAAYLKSKHFNIFIPLLDYAYIFPCRTP